MKIEPRTVNAPRSFLRKCRESLFVKKLVDSTGVTMTGGSLLMRTLIFRRLLMRGVLADDEKFVGLLVPPSAGGILANTAVTLAGRIAVNLNYTVNSDTLNYCIAQCGIRHVLTSRRFMERFDFKLNAELVYLEDLREQVATLDKVAGAIGGYLTPASILERQLGIDKLKDDDLFTIIYTSGSTGQPKGVMLSHGNVGSNMAAIDDLLGLNNRDVVAGILPLFHSIGFTVASVGGDQHGCQRGVSLQPIGRQGDRQAVPRRESDDSDYDADVLALVPRRCAAEEFATFSLVVTGGGEAAARLCWTTSRRNSAFGRWKATARPSCRRSCRSTFRPIARPMAIAVERTGNRRQSDSGREGQGHRR